MKEVYHGAIKKEKKRAKTEMNETNLRQKYIK